MLTGERIRNIREDKDILQQELADSIGMNVSVLSRIEKGTRQLREDELTKIANKLGVTVDYLLGRTPQPSEPTPPPAQDSPHFDLATFIDQQNQVRYNGETYPIDDTDKDRLQLALKVVLAGIKKEN